MEVISDELPTGCSFAFDIFQIATKSSFFVQFMRAMGHLKAKTWGFAINKKKIIKFYPGDKKSAEIRRAIFQLTRLSSQLRIKTITDSEFGR